MINLTVLNLKDLIKALVKFIAIIVFVIICTRLFNFIRNIDIKEYVTAKFKELEGKTYLDVINDNVSIYNPATNTDESENNNSFSISDMFNNILEKEISLFGYIEKEENNNSADNKEKEDGNNEESEIKVASKTGAETEVIEENNKVDSYNKTYNSVKIKNESKYKLSEADLKPDIDFKNKSDIVIYHTHTCESYTKTEKYNYKSSGNYRTTDLNYSVARVGKEIKKYLTKYNFNVIHDTTYHDYPKYNGSYTRSLETISNIAFCESASVESAVVGKKSFSI